MISIGIAPNQKELGAKLGYTSESAFSQIINGKKSEPENFTTRLRTLLPSLNLSWLLTGEGEMLLSSEKSQNAHEIGGVFSAGQKDDGVLMVDYIPTSASATFVESLASGSDVWDEKMPLIPSGNERNEIDELRVFEVEGDSMSPTIISGSLILTKEIPERSWHYAEGVVVAVFAEFVVVKRVAINRLLTDNFLTLSSDNESYGQMTSLSPTSVVSSRQKELYPRQYDKLNTLIYFPYDSHFFSINSFIASNVCSKGSDKQLHYN